MVIIKNKRIASRLMDHLLNLDRGEEEEGGEEEEEGAEEEEGERGEEDE